MSTPVIAGIDIGGTSVHGIAIDPANGLVVGDVRRATVAGPDGVLTELSAAVADLAKATGRPIGGIGVGVPGLVADGAVSHAVNLGIGAAPVDLLGHVRTLTDGPVAVENDVKAAALGAQRWLADTEPEVHDYALVNVGTGLAAGLVLDGRLRRGATGLAGEIGHLTFDRTGPACKCGKRGCLELYASGSGLRRSWDGTALELFTAAAANDPQAVALVEDVVAGLTYAITLLAYTVDVERVLVTGGVVSATPPLRDAVIARLAQDGLTPVGRAAAVEERVRWLPADVPVGAIGAALLVHAEGDR